MSSPSASGPKEYPKSLSAHGQIPVICEVWAWKSRDYPCPRCWMLDVGYWMLNSMLDAHTRPRCWTPDVRYSIFESLLANRYSLFAFAQALFISYVQLESTAAGLPAAILNIGPAHPGRTVGEFTGALHSYSWYLRQDRYVSPSGRFVMLVACEPPFLCAPARWPIITSCLE